RREGFDCPEWTWIRVVPTGVPGSYVVRRSLVVDDLAKPMQKYAAAKWEGGVLTLDKPLFGFSSWSLLRSGDEDWLAPKAKSRAEPGAAVALPRFRLSSRVIHLGPVPSWGVD